MNASKFSEVQKAFILKQGDDGVPVAEISRKAGISQATTIGRKRSGRTTSGQWTCSRPARDRQ